MENYRLKFIRNLQIDKVISTEHQPHPEHLTKNIPYGQALRLKKICSEDQEFDKAAQLLSKKLKSRKYKDEEINIQISKAKSENRDLLLQRRERKPLNRIPCVVTYNKKLPDIKGAIDRHWHLLKINSNLEPVFKEKPFMAFKRNRNLRYLIGQKTLLNDKVHRNKDIRSRKGWMYCPCIIINGNVITFVVTSMIA